MAALLCFVAAALVVWVLGCAVAVAGFRLSMETSHSQAVAAEAFRRFTRRFIAPRVDLGVLLSKLDPGEVRAAFEQQMEPQSAQLIEDVLRAINPGLWDGLRAPVRQMWIDRLRPSVPNLLERVVRLVQDQAKRYIDLEALAAEEVRRNPAILRQATKLDRHTTGREIVILTVTFGAALAAFAILGLVPGHALSRAAVFGATAGALAGWFRSVDFLQLALKRERIAGSLRLTSYFASVVDRTLPQVLDILLNLGPLLSHMNAGERPFRNICRTAISHELNAATGDSAALVAVALGAQSLDKALDAMAGAMADSSSSRLQTLALPPSARQRIKEELERQLGPIDLPSGLSPLTLSYFAFLPVALGGAMGAVAAGVASLLFDN